MSMKNPREVAIKILENAKKALKEKIESLEKSDGKNTAQLNEFKGIPQPPTPKAPAKAIAPTPTIPQPKMPSVGKPSKPLASFMKSRMDKANLNKAKVYTSPVHGKAGINRDLHSRGVGDVVSVSSDKESQEKSLQGLRARRGDMGGAKEAAKETLRESRSMPKPSLPKSEEMNKAKIYDIKSKEMIADYGEPKKTTPPKGNLKLVGSTSTKPQPKTPVKKQPKSAK